MTTKRVIILGILLSVFLAAGCIDTGGLEYDAAATATAASINHELMLEETVAAEVRQ